MRRREMMAIGAGLPAAIAFRARAQSPIGTYADEVGALEAIIERHPLLSGLFRWTERTARILLGSKRFATNRT